MLGALAASGRANAVSEAQLGGGSTTAELYTRRRPSSARSLALGYRPALDGLRAVAIIAVIAFHVLHGFYPLGRFPLSGGYVGVDIFFVLSGFLITSGLLSDRAAGGISLRTFYTRRVRRLVPAQALMLFAFLLGSVALGAANSDPSTVRDALLAAFAVCA